MSEAAKPEQQPEVDLLTNAQDMLERYRLEEGRLEREFDALQIRLEIVRDVIAALTARKRAPRARTRWPQPVPGEPGGDSTPPEAA